MTEKLTALGNLDFILESRQSFTTLYENQLVQGFDGLWRSKAEIWLKSPQRRTYTGITFDPTTTEHNSGRYNLWKGFKYAPKKGDCGLYWDHLLKNICSNIGELYIYFRKWLASIIQRPNKLHTALVLCGSQGVGKNSIVEPIGELLGTHFTVLSSMDELVSHFNFHLKYSILIHANEALWGGHKKDIGTVKAMITDPTCLIEGKGRDRIMVPNFRHLIISSNEAWPVHIDSDDRRFVVIQVSDARKEDHAYFGAIKQQLENGGYEALLYDLMHEDLTDFKPYKLPASNDALEIKMLSADSAVNYIRSVLVEGGFSIGSLNPSDLPAWQGSIPKEDVYADYKAWCIKNGEKTIVSNSVFGKTLKRCIASTEDARPGGTTRVNSYKFPLLVQARKDFCKEFKCHYERTFGQGDVIE